MPTPAWIAPTGSLKTRSSPSMKIWPESGLYRPDRMFMSVVLPAPFSPSMPSTLPRSAEIEILSLARTPGNRLLMSRSSSRIGSASRRCPVWGMQTAPGPRCGPGAVGSVGWVAPGWLAAAPEEAADRDAAVGELRLQRVDLGLEICRELAVVVVVRSQQHAVVLDRAGVVRAAKVPRGDLVEEVEHRDVDGLLGRGKQRPVGRRADADVLVGVDADRKLLVLVHVLDRAVARGAGDRVHDVHALVGEGRRELLALGRIAPRVVAAGAADEGAGCARILEGAVPTEQLDRGGLLLVVVLDAGVQAVHEARDAREGEAAVGADLMGLAPARTEVAREHRGLV